MRTIPWGQTRSYGDLATLTGGVARAVGGACGRNPIPIVVPCHRVVGAGGVGCCNVGSVDSVSSADRVGRVGSVGSISSVGCVGTVGSVGRVGSGLSVGSVGVVPDVVVDLRGLMESHR